MNPSKLFFLLFSDLRKKNVGQFVILPLFVVYKDDYTFKIPPVYTINTPNLSPVYTMFTPLYTLVFTPFQCHLRVFTLVFSKKEV